MNNKLGIVPWILGLVPLFVACDAGAVLSENSWIFTAIYYGLLLVITIIPKAVRLYKTIKAAKEDGIITEDEAKQIKDEALDVIKDVKDGVEKVKDVIDTNKK